MKQLLLIIIGTFVLRTNAFAASSVMINEFQTATPQKVELYNNGTTTLDLSSWYLDDNGGTSYFTIPSGTIIYPDSCVSFSGNFSFNTSSADSVRLFDDTAPPTATNAKLIDAFSYDKIIDETKNFQRIPDGSSIWVAAPPSVDQFNLTGRPCVVLPSPTPTPTPTPTKSPTPSPTSVPVASIMPTSVNSVYISEAMTAPPSGEHEWVELYNDNAFPVTLTNWQLDDGANTGANPRVFTMTIGSYSYGVLELQTAMFNNAGDEIRLLDPSGNLKDYTAYTTAVAEHSWARADFKDQQFCYQTPSKGTVNSGCVGSLLSPTPPSTTYATESSSSSMLVNTPTSIPSKKSPENTLAIATSSSILGADYTEKTDTRESANSQIDDTHVLGTSELNPTIRILSIITILSSLLTIGTVIFRMRVWLRSSISGSPQLSAWESSSFSPPDQGWS